MSVTRVTNFTPLIQQFSNTHLHETIQIISILKNQKNLFKPRAGSLDVFIAKNDEQQTTGIFLHKSAIAMSYLYAVDEESARILLQESTKIIQQETFTFIFRKKFLNIVKEYFNVLEEPETRIHVLSKEKIAEFPKMNFPIPNNVKVVPLQSKDVPIVAKYWKYSAFVKGAEEYIRHVITTNYSMGILEDDKLVSWAALHDDLSMGFAYTLPEYRKKGYSSLINFELAKKLIHDGHVPYLHTEKGNNLPKNLVDKLGYEQFDEFNILWSLCSKKI